MTPLALEPIWWSLLELTNDTHRDQGLGDGTNPLREHRHNVEPPPRCLGNYSCEKVVEHHVMFGEGIL